MRKNKHSVILKEVLLSSFRFWAEYQIKTYQEPKRAGTPKGEKIGLSRSKYACALLQSLYGPFNLAELSKISFSFKIKGIKINGASPGLIKLWRTEDQFREVANQASKDFADKILMDILFLGHDLFLRIIHIQALILLSGFDIANNILINELKKYIKEHIGYLDIKLDGVSQGEINGIKTFYKGLGDFLRDYCDIVAMEIEYTHPSKMVELQTKVSNVINPLKDNIKDLILKAKENSIIGDDYIQDINLMVNFLQYLNIDG